MSEVSRSNRAKFGGAFLCALLSFVVFTPHTEAQSDDARTLFRSGVAHLNESEFADAVADLERARALYPTAPIHFNLGLAYRGADRARDAINAFERFLSAAGDDAEQERVDEVNRYMRTLRARLATVRLDITPDSARVRIDDEPIARDTGRVELDPGAHIIRVEAEGYEGAQRELQLDPGGDTLVQITLSELSDAGTLVLDVTPDGALVRLDGRSRGHGDLELELAAGPHTIFAEFEGNTAEDDFEIVTGERLNLAIAVESGGSRAWVGILIGILVAGAAAGAVTYFVLNPSDEDPLSGSLGTVSTALVFQ